MNIQKHLSAAEPAVQQCVVGAFNWSLKDGVLLHSIKWKAQVCAGLHNGVHLLEYTHFKFGWFTPNLNIHILLFS